MIKDDFEAAEKEFNKLLANAGYNPKMGYDFYADFADYGLSEKNAKLTQTALRIAARVMDIKEKLENGETLHRSENIDFELGYRAAQVRMTAQLIKEIEDEV